MAITRLVQWLRARLTIRQYVSLHLLVGLAICAVCLLGFNELVEEVIDEQEFTRIDLMIAHELHAAAIPPTTQFFEIVTVFGFQVLWVLGVGVGLYLLWKRHLLRLGVWIAALAGGELLNFLLKGLFARPRPSFSDPLAEALYYSFPSGHAMMSLIAYGLVAYFLYLWLPRAWMRVLMTTALSTLVLLIGLSRLYLGVHYFSDVLAGFAVGGLWLSFCITGMNFLRDWRAHHEYKRDENAPA